MKCFCIFFLLVSSLSAATTSRASPLSTIGTFENITCKMKELLATDPPLLIAITHTQQLNALATQLGLPVTRVGNFGMIVMAQSQRELLPDGFFLKSAKS